MAIDRPRLTPREVARLTDEQAFDLIKRARWNGGEPVCPICGCESAYVIRRKGKAGRTIAPTFRCSLNLHTFSATAGTLFANTKLPLNTLLYVISVFVTAKIGVSAEQLASMAGISPTTARVLQHKLREVMAQEQDGRVLLGKVEADGCFVGGHNRKKNEHDDRDDRRRQRYQIGAKCVFAVRQRKGPTLVAVFEKENEGRKFILDHVEKHSTIFTDKASYFQQLAAHGRYYCINHKQRYFATENGELVHTNNVESFFNRLRDAEHTYGHISGEHLFNFAVEQAWRQDHRKHAAEERFLLILRQACASGPSEVWTRYWQRRTGRNKTRRPNPVKVRNALRRGHLEELDRWERIFEERLADRTTLPEAEEGMPLSASPQRAA